MFQYAQQQLLLIIAAAVHFQAGFITVILIQTERMGEPHKIFQAWGN